MFNTIHTEYKNGKIVMNFDLADTSDFDIEILKNVMGVQFVKKVQEEIIKPTVFIPNEFELEENEGMFIDIYYKMEDVKYPHIEVKDGDKDFLTDDGEIGKNLFFVEKEDNTLSITFSSLVVLNQEGELESIFDYQDKKIQNLFESLVLKLIKE